MDDKLEIVLREVKRCLVSELEELCQILKVEIPDTKKNNPRAINNLQVRMLTSEEVEESEDERGGDFC